MEKRVWRRGGGEEEVEEKRGWRRVGREEEVEKRGDEESWPISNHAQCINVYTVPSISTRRFPTT